MGQAPFGARVLEALRREGCDVVAVYTPPGKPGGRMDPLKAAALREGIPMHEPAGYKAPEALAAFAAARPDLLVMAFVTAILPPAFLAVPPRGAICYHPSLLPRHRGGSAIHWAVILGEEETGLTVFWPDGGIDTGPILLQKRAPIQPDDTTGSLYFDRLFPLGVEALVESVHLIAAGKAPRIPQDETKATYEPLCDDRVARIDWTKPGRKLYNLIRGCDPQPGAYAFWRGEQVRLLSARFLPGDRGKPPATILVVTAAGLDITVAGGMVRAALVRTGPEKLSPETLSGRGLRPGERFS